MEIYLTIDENTEFSGSVVGGYVVGTVYNPTDRSVPNRNVAGYIDYDYNLSAAVLRLQPLTIIVEPAPSQYTTSLTPAV